jgi:copper homeostasis protein
MELIDFEVCCGSAEDALAAYRGGARQAELCSDLFHGGLTTTLGALRTVKKHAPELRVMCMVRPREGGFCYTDTEYETMLEDARVFVEHGADGVVFGFLHEDGTVDADRCREMLAVIGDRESVFHRAIDVTPDILAALDTLMELGVTRVLTSGRQPTVPEGAETIKNMIARANGRIQVLPGGGITPENIAWCKAATGARMVHAAIHRTAYDRSTSGNPAIYYGGAVYPPEDRYALTHAEDVAAFLKAGR